MSAAAESLPDAADASAKPHRVAYVMSRFPKLTETFVLFELLAMRDQGVEVDVYPLLRARNTSTHAEAGGLIVKLYELLRRPDPAATTHSETSRLEGHVHYGPLLSPGVLLANLRAAAVRPRRYFGALAALVRATWGSANYLLGGLCVFPRSVAIALELERHGVEHVHAHFANHPAAAAFVIRRISGIPYSFTAHGSDFQVDQHMLREKVLESAFTVAISDANRRFLLECVGSDCAAKIVVIRCGVDRLAFAGAPEAHAKGPIRILCVGTLYEVKGQRYLLDACARLSEAGVAFECRLVGDGPDREALAARARRLGISDRVIFVGRMTHEQVVAEMRAADAVVVPSVLTRDGRREGIPVVCMEAMAGGAVLVASRISGIPEIVEDEKSGLLVPPRDADALAEALLRLEGDPGLRRRLAAGGLARVEEECDLGRNTGRLLARMQAVHR